MSRKSDLELAGEILGKDVVPSKPAKPKRRRKPKNQKRTAKRARKTRRAPKRRTAKRKTAKRRAPKRRTAKRRTTKRRSPKRRAAKRKTAKRRSPKSRMSAKEFRARVKGIPAEVQKQIRAIQAREALNSHLGGGSSPVRAVTIITSPNAPKSRGRDVRAGTIDVDPYASLFK